MWMKHSSTVLVVLITVFALAFVVLVMKITPGAKAPKPVSKRFSDEEIAHHDPYLPKYFLAGAAMLVLGGLHYVVKNVPPLFQWLYEAGYGGHMVRDLSNMHIIIVGGGTLLLTGLTWYALPRVVRRPLYSEGLAQWAFWCTLVGVFSFYVVLTILGLVIGGMVRQGQSFDTVRLQLGGYYNIPLAISSSVMGVGYWTFVANVYLTVYRSFWAQGAKPHLHLAKFFVVGATGLLAGTIQGVIQVQPDNITWLHRADIAGDFIDPISHAHVNLVTGVSSIVAGLTFFLLPRLNPAAQISKRAVNWVFWLLTVGSIAFYVTFFAMGEIEGGWMVFHNLTYEQALAKVGIWHPLLMAGAGIAMVIGYWTYLTVAARKLLQQPPTRRPMALRQAGAAGRWWSAPTPRAFLVAAIGALFVGTFQGPIQALEPVQMWMRNGGELGDSIAHAHEMLNIVGGVMVALMGLVYLLLPDLTGYARRPRLVRLSFWGTLLGAASYYVISLGFSLAETAALQSGRLGDADSLLGYQGPHVGAIAAVTPFIPLEPLLLLAAGALVLAGFGSFAANVYLCTAAYRARSRTVAQRVPLAWHGPVSRRVLRRNPLPLLAMEAGGCLVGFPGLGWLMAGFGLPGIVMLCVGPALCWAGLPLLFTPYGAGFLIGIGPMSVIYWLGGTATLSTLSLAVAIRRRRARLLGVVPPPGARQSVDPAVHAAAAPQPAPTSARIQHAGTVRPATVEE